MNMRTTDVSDDART